MSGSVTPSRIKSAHHVKSDAHIELVDSEPACLNRRPLKPRRRLITVNRVNSRDGAITTVEERVHNIPSDSEFDSIAQSPGLSPEKYADPPRSVQVLW